MAACARYSFPRRERLYICILSGMKRGGSSVMEPWAPLKRWDRRTAVLPLLPIQLFSAVRSDQDGGPTGMKPDG